MSQITVVGDSAAGEEALRLAEQVGRSVAELGFAIVTGGRGGIMAAANKGAYEAGGISIGILPSQNPGNANAYCNIVIPTGMGHARNALTALACDAIVAIGGGAGTLSELCFSWIHDKPVFVFPQFGGWSEKLADNVIDNRRSDRIVPCNSVEDLVDYLRKLFLK
jgi:hypothetical protein